MILEQLFDRESSTYTYLLGDEETREAALVDPVLENLERDLTLVSELGLRLTHVLETHVHADHVTAAGALKVRTSAITCASAAGAPCVDRRLQHGDVIRVGNQPVTALATPGHTDDGISYLFAGHVLTGDTLLIRGCGRADFQNGSARELYDSIHKVLFKLPDETVVLPAHDYRGLTRSTIGLERRYNPRIAGASQELFVERMNALGLPPPAKLHIAVPRNRACGNDVDESARQP
jgi:sulfur dioxygenase